jgi:hypothetical protein
LAGERFVNPGMKVRGRLAFNIPMSVRLERLQFITIAKMGIFPDVEDGLILSPLIVN